MGELMMFGSVLALLVWLTIMERRQRYLLAQMVGAMLSMHRELCSLVDAATAKECGVCCCQNKGAEDAHADC